jgi:hypothetical protein
VGAQELKVSMRLLPSLVGWLNLDRQVCRPNQSVLHLILFKETRRRPEDYVRREEHELEDGLLNWVRKERRRRRLAQFLSKDGIKRQLLTLDDP